MLKGQKRKTNTESKKGHLANRHNVYILPSLRLFHRKNIWRWVCIFPSLNLFQDPHQRAQFPDKWKMSCSRTLQATARVNIGLPSLYMMVRGGRYRPTRQKLFDPPTLTPTRERERKHDAERDFFNSIVLGRFCTLTPLRKISFAREHGDQPETWRKLENWSHSRTSSWCRPSTAGAESIITEFIHVCFRFIRSLLCERRTGNN